MLTREVIRQSLSKVRVIIHCQTAMGVITAPSSGGWGIRCL